MLALLFYILSFIFKFFLKVDTQALLRRKEENDSDDKVEIPPRPSNSAMSLQDQVQRVFEEALGVDGIGEVCIFVLLPCI